MATAIEEFVGPSEHLIELAREGRFSKQALALLLPISKRRTFLDACAAIERRYTEACTATGDPCLEGGCAAAGEICLEPLLRAGEEYLKACGAEWARLVDGYRA